MQTIGDRGDGSRTWFPATHFGSPGLSCCSWLQPWPTLFVADGRSLILKKCRYKKIFFPMLPEDFFSGMSSHWLDFSIFLNFISRDSCKMPPLAHNHGLMTEGPFGKEGQGESYMFFLVPFSGNPQCREILCLKCSWVPHDIPGKVSAFLSLQAFGSGSCCVNATSLKSPTALGFLPLAESLSLPWMLVWEPPKRPSYLTSLKRFCFFTWKADL